MTLNVEGVRGSDEEPRRPDVTGMTRTPLSTLVKRWAKALSDAACGPLVVAQEICGRPRGEVTRGFVA